MNSLLKKSWLSVLSGLATLACFVPFSAFAEDHAAAAASTGVGTWAIFGAAIGLGIAVFGAASAQGKIGGAYMEGISRNPGAENVMKTQLILSLVFVETLVIFTLGAVLAILFK